MRKGPLLKDAVRKWLDGTTEVAGVAGLANAVGEKVEPFRMRLHRNRFSAETVKALVSRFHFADSVEALERRYKFDLSKKATRKMGKELADVEYRVLIDQILAGEKAKDADILEAELAELDESDIAYVICCKLSQKPILPELERLKSSAESTLIIVWEIFGDVASDGNLFDHMFARLRDETFQKVIVSVLATETNIHFHFLLEVAPLEKDVMKTVNSTLASCQRGFLKNLNVVAKNRHEQLEPGRMKWYSHYFKPSQLVGMHDQFWIHLFRSEVALAWGLKDNASLRNRFSKTDNPWRYSTLAAAYADDDAKRTLQRLGYKVGFEGWKFDPDDKQEQYLIGQEGGEKL